MCTGPADELRPLLEALVGQGVFVRELDTRGAAFHSPLLEPTLPALRACAHARLPSLPGTTCHMHARALPALRTCMTRPARHPQRVALRVLASLHARCVLLLVGAGTAAASQGRIGNH